MSTNHNRIKVADLETNQPDKILTTNENGEIQFTDVNTIQQDSHNGPVKFKSVSELTPVTATTPVAVLGEDGLLQQIPISDILALAGGGGSTPTLEQVLTEGNVVPQGQQITFYGDNTKDEYGYAKFGHSYFSGFDYTVGFEPQRIMVADNINYKFSDLTPNGLTIKTGDGSSGQAIFKSDNIGIDTFVTLQAPNKATGTYTLATLDDIDMGVMSVTGYGVNNTDSLNPTINIPSVSSSVIGLVDNTSLQELGGVDKSINGVRIGRGPGNIPTNTVLGNFALRSNTAGGSLTAIGIASLYNNISGTESVAIGPYSGYYNVTGSFNNYIGVTAGYYNYGSSNIAIGFLTLAGNPGSISSNLASNNIALGTYAGRLVSTGNGNILLENYSKTSPNATGQISTGSNNIIIRQGASRATAGSGITTGSGNTILGYATGLAAAASNLVIIADGSGNVAVKKATNGEVTSPSLTIALVNSGGAKSLTTKEYSDALTNGFNPVKATQFSVSALNTAPASATSTGTLGEIRIVSDYIYICIATDTWVRSALATW